MADDPRIVRARNHGTLQPGIALEASQEAGIPFNVACAFLERESSGGRNVFGSDPTHHIGMGEVTETKYRCYAECRDEGKGVQGVGPMQLTHRSFQDEADRRGGCWRPKVNMVVAFEHLARLRLQTANWRDAARRYNGSGPEAERYADEIAEQFDVWQGWLSG